MAKDRNVYLIGHMGVGKTAVGRKLAKLLKKPFVDTDAIVERRAKRRISQIFATKGEAAFRRLELAAVKDAAKKGGSVVALGGGAMTRADVRRVVKDSGFVIRLTADQGTLWTRLKKDAAQRPLLKGGRSAFAALLKKRKHHPNGDARVSTTSRTAAQAAVEAARLVKNRG